MLGKTIIRLQCLAGVGLASTYGIGVTVAQPAQLDILYNLSGVSLTYTEILFIIIPCLKSAFYFQTIRWLAYTAESTERDPNLSK